MGNPEFDSDTPFFSRINETHTSAIGAFELTSGLGFTEQICSTHGVLTDASTAKDKRMRRRTGSQEPESQISLAELADTALDESHSDHTWRSLLLNYKELALLLLLYTIQGIPMGLATSVPFVLQGHVGYAELGVFSLVSLPFSCKVFWAPIVDALYVPRIGRRKSWLLPVQIICALVMYIGGSPTTVDAWMGGAGLTHSTLTDLKPNVTQLVVYFSLLYFLMATQDIAVDGWSLTLLNDENRAFSSACNAIGQTLGFSIAHVGFLALRDPATCNHWFRRTPSQEGIVTLGSFLRFWSYIVFFATVVACCFPEREETYASLPKNETEVSAQSDTSDAALATPTHSILDTYKLLYQLVFVKPVLALGFVLLTCRIGFATIDAAAHLKLIEAGMSKEELAFFGPFLLPISLICPLLVGRVTCGPRPLRWFLRGWKLRLGMTFIWLGVLYLTQRVYSQLPPGTPPSLWFYATLVTASVFHNVFTDVMFSAQMAFFARVSDPAIGGTYMTFLNTVGNLGNKWPTVLALMTLEHFDRTFGSYGFSLQALCCTIIGLLWLVAGLPLIRQLERCPREQWLVIKLSTLGKKTRYRLTKPMSAG